jgi:hypothetical protein
MITADASSKIDDVIAAVLPRGDDLVTNPSTTAVTEKPRNAKNPCVVKSRS